MEGNKELETKQEQSINFFRSLRLLIDVGTEVLRDVLLQEIPLKDLQNEVQKNASLISTLKKKKVLTEPQYNLLQKKPPDPTEFDISLLVALLRNMCTNIKAPNPDWSILIPFTHDLSIGADLIRIKNIRNTRMHLSTTLMPRSTFTPLWTELKGIILRIADGVGPESTAKATMNIENLEKDDIDPSGEKEKQTLKTLQEWKTQYIDIMHERINCVSNSLESVRHKSDAAFDSVDAVRSITEDTNKKVKSMQDQLTQICQDFSSLSSESQRCCGDHHKLTTSADVTDIKQELQKMQEELVYIKQLYIQNWTTETNQQQNPGPNQGVQNVEELTDKEIDSIAGKIGFEWERLGLYLDFERGQTDALKDIYRDQPFMRNVTMIQSWRDVVVRCGESPRTLLAAAFASLENNEMAQSLFSPEHVKKIKDKEARRETKSEISSIKFDRYDRGKRKISQKVKPAKKKVNSLVSKKTIIGGDVFRIDAQTVNLDHCSRRSSRLRGNKNDGKHFSFTFRSQPMFSFCKLPSFISKPTSLPGSFIQIEDRRVLVLDQHKLVDVSKSVGKISGNGFCGTCFRVGSKYVMTALHVLKDIATNGYISLGAGSTSRSTEFAALEVDDVYVNFDFLSPTDGYRQKFHLTSNVVFHDNVMDIAVVELKPEQNYPPPFRNFSQPPSGGKFTFVGHPSGDPKQLNQVDRLVNLDDHTKRQAVSWSRQVAQIDGFAGIDTPGRILFHCSFKKGGSGSPGIAIVGDKAVVVTVLLHGYPDWYYDPTFDHRIKIGVQPDQRIEQGADMTRLYYKMHEDNRDLCYAIFGANE